MKTLQENLSPKRVKDILNSDNIVLTTDDIEELGLDDKFKSLIGDAEFNDAIKICLTHGETKQNPNTLGINYLNSLTDKTKFENDNLIKLNYLYQAYERAPIANRLIKNAIFSNKLVLALSVEHLKVFLKAIIAIQKHLGDSISYKTNSGNMDQVKCDFRLLFQDWRNLSETKEDLEKATPRREDKLNDLISAIKTLDKPKEDEDEDDDYEPISEKFSDKESKGFIDNNPGVINQVAIKLKKSSKPGKQAAGNLLVKDGKKNIRFYNTLRETAMAGNDDLNNNLCKLLFWLVGEGLYDSGSDQDSKFRFIIMQTSAMLNILRKEYLKEPKNPKVSWLNNASVWSKDINLDDFKTILFHFCIILDLIGNLKGYIDVEEAKDDMEDVSINKFFNGKNLKPLGSKGDTSEDTILGQFNYWIKNYPGDGKDLGDREQEHDTSSREYDRKENKKVNSSKEVFNRLDRGLNLSDEDSTAILKALNNPKNREQAKQIKDLLAQLLQTQ